MVEKTDKTYRKWIKRIEHEKKEHDEYRKTADKALKAYESQQDKQTEKKAVVFPILRNVVEVQLGLIAAKQPQAKLSKRFDNDQTQLCMKLEKAVNYFVESGQMQSEGAEAFEDYLTSGLGGLRVQYEAEVDTKIIDDVIIDPITQLETVVQEAVEVQEKIVNERLWAERYEWCNFIWEPCKRWSECDWIGFKSTLTLDQFQREYKVYPNKYDKGEKDDKADITIYEIWDRLKQKRITICENHSEVLDEEDNPLGTEYFYPCAEPMFFACLHDDYEPRPEFYFWADLHDKVQELSRRESALIKGIKDIEFYDQNVFSDVARLEHARDGAKIPVNMAKYMSEGGKPDINAAISPKDHTSRMLVLDKITEKRNELLDKIYQNTGIADIMQGISDPRETARAQGYKNAWGNARLAQKRYAYENHIRGTIEVMVNTMAKLFQPEMIGKAAGIALTPEEAQYLQQSDEYRTDVETLSTLSMDKDRDQQNAIDLTNSVASLFAQGQTIPAPITQALLQNMVRTFPDGREFEATLETLPQYIDQVQQLGGQLQQLQQQLAEMQQQNTAMAAELSKHNQATEIQKIADAEKKAAETEKTKAETAQIGNEAMVPFDALVDERIAYQQQPVQIIPNGL